MFHQERREGSHGAPPQRSRGQGMAAETAALRFDFLILVLKLIQLAVDAVATEQLLMRSHLADFSFMENDDLVRVLDRREAMCDNNRRAALQ